MFLRAGLAAVVCMTAALASIWTSAEGDGGAATDAPINGPAELSIAPNGDLYITAMMEKRVRIVSAKTGLIHTYAGNGNDCCFREGAKASSTSWFGPKGTALDASGNLYIIDTSSQVRRVDATTRVATTVVAELDGEDADKPGTAPALPQFESANGLAFDKNGDLYISGSGAIYKLSSGAVSVFAGTEVRGFSGDGLTADHAQFHDPEGIALDPAGNLLVADYTNCRVRRIDAASHTVSTIVGTGVCETKGDGGKAVDAAINYPDSIAVDRQGNIFVTGYPPGCVRRIDARTGVIRSLRGTCDHAWYKPPSEFQEPSGLAVDAEGNLYVSEFSLNVVLRVDAKTGKIRSYAGNGSPHRVDVQL